MRTMIGVLIPLALLVTLAPAAALPPPKGKKGGAKGESVKQLEEQAKDLQRQVDTELLRLFQDQVQASAYRSRLSILLKEWSKLFASQAPTTKLPTPPRPLGTEFAVDVAVASDQDGLEQAYGNPTCKRRAGCKIWARIAFGPGLAKKGDKFELTAEVKSKTGTTKLAVPAKEMVINGPVMTVDLPLDSLYIYKGSYEGTLKVLCADRFKRKTFSFDILE